MEEGSGDGGSGEGDGEEFDDRGPADHDFPILVFEGLRKPKGGETDEDLVAEVLRKSANLSAMACRRAIRLPMLDSSMKSIVLVELDTVEHENAVIKGKSDFARKKKIEIRKAKYKELWKYVEELTVVKRLDHHDKGEGDAGEVIEEGEAGESTEASIAGFRDRKKSSHNVATTPETDGESAATLESENTAGQKPSITRARSSKILFFK